MSLLLDHTKFDREVHAALMAALPKEHRKEARVQLTREKSYAPGPHRILWVRVLSKELGSHRDRVRQLNALKPIDLDAFRKLVAEAITIDRKTKTIHEEQAAGRILKEAQTVSTYRALGLSEYGFARDLKARVTRGPSGAYALIVDGLNAEILPQLLAAVRGITK